MNEPDPERSRRVRRSAILLGCVALGFYVAFIMMSVLGFRT
jgi:hypothetical protein